MKRTFILTVLIFCLIPTCLKASEYKDIQGHWAKEYIDYMNDEGLINGFEDGSFRPDKPIKKSQIYKIINRIFNFSEESDLDYKDKDLWYIKELKRAVKAGYINYDRDFKDDNIERKDFINILGSIYGLSDKEDNYRYFNDLDTLDPLTKSYIGALLKDGIIKGYGNSNLKPDSGLTRGEASKIISLAIKKYGREALYKMETPSKPQGPSQELSNELIFLVNDSRNLNLSNYSQESAQRLNEAIAKGERILLASWATDYDISESIKEIREARDSLKIKLQDPRLFINAIDSSGNPVDANYYINNQPFISGSTLEKGRYLLKAVSSYGYQATSYINMDSGDKSITITFDDEGYNERLELILKEHLSCSKGRFFNKNERVQVQIHSPEGMKLDYLLVNGRPKRTLDEEYNFIIKENTTIEAVFIKKEVNNEP